MFVIYAKTAVFDIALNEEYVRRLIELRGRRFTRLLAAEEFQDEYRRLQQQIPVANLHPTQAQNIYHNHQNNVPQTITVSVNGVTYSGTLGRSLKYVEENKKGCTEYKNIREEGTNAPLYDVECCPGDTECSVYQKGNGHDRHLAQRELSHDDYDYCFAPLTLVDVEGQGATYIKDVQPGDRVLAQGGKYQTFYTFNHFSKTQQTPFVQLITEESTLELSSVHMVYLYGKDGPVQAGHVKVGDMLINREQEPVEVTKIDEVVREGLYFGHTADGTIMANGVLASTHASHLGFREYVIDVWGYKLIHAASIEHFVERPMRKFCLAVSVDLCNQWYTQDEDADIHRNIWDRIGHLWKVDFCEKYHIPEALSLGAMLLVVFVLNFLATPNLVIGVLLLVLGRKKRSTIVGNKKLKSA